MCRRNLNAAHKLELQFANKDELLAVGKEKREQNLMRGKVKPEMSDTDTSEEPTTHGKTAPGKTLLSNTDKSVDVPHDTRQQIAAAAGVATGTVAMAASIQAEANKKRSEAAKEGKVGRASTKQQDSLVVVPAEQVLNEADRAPGRAARAEDAGVSPRRGSRFEDVAGEDYSDDCRSSRNIKKHGISNPRRTFPFGKVDHSTHPHRQGRQRTPHHLRPPRTRTDCGYGAHAPVKLYTARGATNGTEADTIPAWRRSPLVGHSSSNRVRWLLFIYGIPHWGMA